MTLDRTVFSTDVAIDTINPNWVASGAIEIGIQVSAGAVSQQAVCRPCRLYLWISCRAQND